MMDERADTARWWQPYLNVLLYPVQFDTHPSERIAHGLDICFRSSTDEARAFATAIEAALASGDALLLVGQPGPVPQSQAEVRAYLAGVAQGIAARLDGSRGA